VHLAVWVAVVHQEEAQVLLAQQALQIQVVAVVVDVGMAALE
jgi:hypothetical protein